MGSGLRLVQVGDRPRPDVSLAIRPALPIQSPRRSSGSEPDGLAAGTLESTLGALIGPGR